MSKKHILKKFYKNREWSSEEDSIPSNLETNFQSSPNLFNTDIIFVIFLIILSFIVHFYTIDSFPERIFDEIFFGNFTNYYLNRTYNNIIIHRSM